MGHEEMAARRCHTALQSRAKQGIAWPHWHDGKCTRLLAMPQLVHGARSNCVAIGIACTRGWYAPCSQASRFNFQPAAKTCACIAGLAAENQPPEFAVKMVHLLLLLLLRQTSRLEPCRLSWLHFPQVLVVWHWLWNEVSEVQP